MENLNNTQQSIIDAAILVFNEDFSAPLEKVAEKASVTRRTLHRYFKDRDTLLKYCEKDMQRNCRRAVEEAFESSDIPLKKLEQMFYAAIDCGAKHAFLHKLHHRNDHKHSKNNRDCASYESINDRCRQLILQLQKDGFISKKLTAGWILIFLSSVVSATISAESIDATAKITLNKYAWFSFSKGIGI